MTNNKQSLNRRMLKYVFWALAVGAGLLSVVKQPAYRQAMVVKVYDGDTVGLSDGQKVRLIGIDTPEEHDSDKLFADAHKSGQDVATIKAMGQKAHQFTSHWVLGQTVRLEFDQERRDKYGRLLAYLYMPFPHPPLSSLPRAGYIVNVDGKKWYFINATIIQAGYAKPMVIAPNDKHKAVFQSLYQQAQENHLGLWEQKVSGKRTRGF